MHSKLFFYQETPSREPGAVTERQNDGTVFASRKGRKKPSLSHPGIKVRPASASASRAGAENIFCFFLNFLCFLIEKITKKLKMSFFEIFEFLYVFSTPAPAYSNPNFRFFESISPQDLRIRIGEKPFVYLPEIMLLAAPPDKSNPCTGCI